MGRTPKTVEDRREQIADAAIRVFAQKGFSETTIKDIAQEAGITSGLIYHYFENKDALLEEIIKGLSASRMVRELPPEKLSQPLEPLLTSILTQVLDVVEGEKYLQFIRIYLPEIVHHPELVSFGVIDIQGGADFLERILAARIEKGEICPVDPAFTAQMLLSTLIGFVLRRQIFHDAAVLQYSHEQIAGEIVIAFLQGLQRCQGSD